MNAIHHNMQILTSYPQLSMISLQCIRSLVLSAGKQDGAASDIASAYVRLLIPHVIIWLLGVSEELCGDSGRISTGEEAVEESLKLLLLLYGTTPDDRKSKSKFHPFHDTLLNRFSVILRGRSSFHYSTCFHQFHCPVTRWRHVVFQNTTSTQFTHLRLSDSPSSGFTATSTF